MSIIGTIIPEITKLLISFEKWDYPEDVTKNEIWRNFISQMLNLAIFTVIAYKGIYDISFVDELFNSHFAEANTDNGSTTCRYDVAGKELCTLIFTEIGTQILFELGKALSRKLFF